MNNRIKDENNPWNFSEGMGEFVSVLQEKFPGIRITSGQRDGEGSKHSTGNAVDIGVNRSTDADALRMYTWLMNDADGLQLMSDYGLGVIDETDPEKMSPHATGPHFHIGQDPHYAEKVNDRLGQFDSYYTYSGRDGAKYKKEGDAWTIDVGEGYNKIVDPTGKRTELLNAQAVINNERPSTEFSFYSNNSGYDYGKSYTPTGGQSIPDNSDTESIASIPFELVEGSPEFEFMQEIKNIQKKEEEKTKKEEESEARQVLKQKKEEKEFKRQQFIDAVANNTNPNKKVAPRQRQQAISKMKPISLQSQTQLPNMPKMSEMPKFPDGGKLKSKLEENTHVPFVDRIVNQKNYPVRPNEDGTVSSHLMAWASDDTGYFAYPTLQYMDGQFQEFKDPKYAIKRGNILRFDTAEEAEAFADGSWKKEYSFSDGGGVGDPPPTYADSLEAYNWGKSLNTGVQPYTEKLIDNRFGINDTPYRFDNFDENKIGDFVVKPIGYSNSDTHYPIYRKPKKAPNPRMSVVDNLREKGIDSSYDARKKIAADAGIDNYTGTQKQNIILNNYVFSKYDNTNKPKPSRGLTPMLQDRTRPAPVERVDVENLPMRRPSPTVQNSIQEFQTPPTVRRDNTPVRRYNTKTGKWTEGHDNRGAEDIKNDILRWEFAQKNKDYRQQQIDERKKRSNFGFAEGGMKFPYINNLPTY